MWEMRELGSPCGNLQGNQQSETEARVSGSKKKMCPS